MVISDGSDEMEIISTVYILRRAGLDVEIARCIKVNERFEDYKTPLMCTCLMQVKISADKHLDNVRNINEFDAVVLPGWTDFDGYYEDFGELYHALKYFF